MRLLTWIYVNLKQIFKLFPIMIGYVVGLPLVISLLMGTLTESLFENPNEISPLVIDIVDNDQSELSKQLVLFLSSDEVSTLLDVSSDEPDALLTIEKGYADKLLSNSPLTLELQALSANTHQYAVKGATSLLDEYHKQLSIALSNNETITNLYSTSAISFTEIETALSLNSTTYYAVSLMSFTAIMLIMSVSAASYKAKEMGLTKRYYAAPLTRLKMLHYDMLSNVIYIFIVFATYMLIYRLLGDAFVGNVALLSLGALATAIFVTVCGAFVSTYFSSKYGLIITNIIFFIQIFLGGTFLPSGLGITVSPGYYITEIFENLVLHDTFASIQSPLLMLLLISFVVYILTIFKEKFFSKGVR